MTTLLRVRTSWVGVLGTPYLTTTYWAGSTVPTVAEAQSSVDRMRDYFSASPADFNQLAAWTVEGNVDVVDDTTGLLIGAVGAVPRTGTGSGTTDMLPAEAQGLHTLVTAAVVGGRRIQGRLFIPAPCEASNLAGAPSAAYITSRSAASAGLLTAGPTQLRVFSRKNLSSAPVTSILTRGYWAALRSRRT